MSGGRRVAEAVFDADPANVARARRLVRELLVDRRAVHRGDRPAPNPRRNPPWPPEQVDDTQLAVSELMTNALVHAGTRVVVRVVVDPDCVRVEVRDRSPVPPRPRQAERTSITGRGLSLVDRLVSRWGSETRSGEKTVWFELRRDPAPRRSHEAAAHVDLPSVRRAAAVAVLRDCPLLLHSAWQEHAAAVLREQLLTALSDDLDVLERHAAASSALSLLAEQVPTTAAELEGLRRGVFPPDADVTAAEVRLAVPAAQVTSFDVLGELLDGARSMPQGRFSTPPMLPEAVAMRRWICEQVRSQTGSRGTAVGPRPWDPEAVAVDGVADPADVGGEGGWDTGLLSDDEAGFLIDGSGRIVAATPAASDALASAGVGSGVRGRGRRFIDLVPRGRRQAVLAAFTLQLATDRGLAGVRAPLSDLGVRGPLGSMALGLRRRRTASGRWLLVATLDPP